MLLWRFPRQNCHWYGIILCRSHQRSNNMLLVVGWIVFSRVRNGATSTSHSSLSSFLVLILLSVPDAQVLIIIIIMGSYNERHIYPIGYSRRRCGATALLIRQPQAHRHNEEPEIRNWILWEWVRFLAVCHLLGRVRVGRVRAAVGNLFTTVDQKWGVFFFFTGRIHDSSNCTY